MPQSLPGTLFAAAALLWWAMLSVLASVASPGAPGVGFWVGAVIASGAGFGWGFALGRQVAQRLTASGGAGVMRAAGAGIALLLFAGATAFAAALAATTLAAGPGATWGVVRQVFPSAVVVVAVVALGAPFGGAAGLVLRALAAGEAPIGESGSARR